MAFNERPPLAKAVAIVVLVVSLVVVATAERDIQRRSDAQVRGSRRLWRLLSLNALGAGAYLRFGRRPS